MITVVSGLPRSGTSMMMQVLVAGGIPPLTDHERKPDADNPRGYYELEVAKKIKTDTSWLAEAEGKVFKIVSMLLTDLPATHRYRIVFMVRDLDEVLASQAVMLQRKGEAPKAPDTVLKPLYAKHLAEIREWLAVQAHMDVYYCRHRAMIEDPRTEIDRLAAFLGDSPDTAAMRAAVDPSLHRQKR
jgi:hypothetical protein